MDSATNTQVDEDLFTDDFGKWIEKHGGELFVTAESVSIIGMDLNDLKSAIIQLKPRESHKGTESLIEWWFETNGTGTEACHKCLPSERLVCTWHQARLDDLTDILSQRKGTGQIATPLGTGEGETLDNGESMTDEEFYEIIRQSAWRIQAASDPIIAVENLMSLVASTMVRNSVVSKGAGIAAFITASRISMEAMPLMIHRLERGFPEMTAEIIGKTFAEIHKVMNENDKYMRPPTNSSLEHETNGSLNKSAK